MKLFSLKFATIVFIIIFFYSCQQKNQTDSNPKNNYTLSNIKYAKGFEIQQFKTYKKLIIKTPYQNANETFEYILTNNSKATSQNSIQIPLNSIVVTSTTHIPMLELLQVENKLIGYPNTKYISSKKTRTLIDSGAIKDL